MTRKLVWLDLLERIKRGVTATSVGPMFVASSRDMVMIDQLADYIKHSEAVKRNDTKELT